MALILIAGLATAFNIIIIISKLRNKKWLDAAIDVTAFILISTIFIGTLTGMSIGMVASAMLSVYLLAFPFKGDSILKPYMDKASKLYKKYSR